MDIKILVIGHKEFDLPKKDGYRRMIVGSNKDSFCRKSDLRDDTEQNISEKNLYYSELTAIYWAWKNLTIDAIGVVHYRRFFMSERNQKKLISTEEIQDILTRVPVILPKKRHYFIETTWTQYKHAHHIEDLEKVRKEIEKHYPDDLPAFDSVMKKKSGHRFNMFIMKKEEFSAYCEWLFKILGEVEEVIPYKTYDAYNQRVFGFLSERLLDVWLIARTVAYKEIPYKFTEKQNWLKKGWNFIYRKFSGKRRVKSNL